MEKQAVDVLILGAGPSGAACALSLCRYSENRVLVIDRGDLQQVRVGEHVSSSVFGFLDYLQVDQTKFSEHCFNANYGRTSYWGSSFANTHNSLFTAAGQTYQLQREEFDLKLLEQLVDAGGYVLPRSYCKLIKQKDSHHWQVDIEHPSRGKMQIQTKYLIDASGRTSSLRRKLGINREKTDKLVGVGAFLELSKDISHDQLIETYELGWWYSARIGEKLAVVIFFSDSDIISKHQLQKLVYWNQLLNKTQHMRKRLNVGVSSGSKLWVKPANSQTSRWPQTQNFIAIGDAAAAFDPISSMGLGFALSSACHGAKAICCAQVQGDNEPLDIYANDIQNNFFQYQITHRKIYQQEHRFPNAIFWQRRHRG